MVDCLVAGDANVDLLVEGLIELRVGTELLASDLNLVVGGSSAITAYNLSRLGAEVGFIGVIGQDLFGRFVEEKLASAGIDLSGVRKSRTEKTGITIWHTKRGKRAGVTYAGTIAMLEPRDIPDQRLRSARHLHVGAYFLQARLHAGAARLFARAKKLGLTTSLDCNYDPLEKWDSNLSAVLKYTDVFLPNEDEAMKIARKGTAEAAARELAKIARTVVVKRGEKGAFVASGSVEFAAPTTPVKVVDTTGAGDSFNAGFLAKFLKQASLAACTAAGLKAGARCVRYAGGTAGFEK